MLGARGGQKVAVLNSHSTSSILKHTNSMQKVKSADAALYTSCTLLHFLAHLSGNHFVLVTAFNPSAIWKSGGEASGLK